jgi:hypothetical protein
MKSFVAIALGVFLAGEPQTPPQPLIRALGRIPGLRLLDPASDLRGVYTPQGLQDLGVSLPWVVRDVDGDGRADVVAVVVQPDGVSPKFGVVAIHSRTPGEAHWVIPLGTDVINGVAGGAATDVVTPLFCVECDANGWLRWNGRAYEEGLFRRGERVVIGAFEAGQAAALFASPRPGAAVVDRPPQCAPAVVRRVGGSAQNRWYLVETTTAGRRGWVPSTSLVEENECDGV